MSRLFVLLLTGLGLIFAGMGVRGWMLWSSLSSSTLPWLLSALGVCLILESALRALTGRHNGPLPRGVVRAAIVLFLVVLCIGLSVDALTYGTFMDDGLATVGEFVGFSLLLAVCGKLAVRGDESDPSPDTISR